MTTPLDTPPVSGQWEQYVEKAADQIQRVVYGSVAELSGERECCAEAARAVLAVVAPLIAEDTRTRMVEAAAAAVKREGGGSERAKVAEEIAEAFEERRSIPGWGVFSRQSDRLTAARMVRQYARQLDAREQP